VKRFIGQTPEDDDASPQSARAQIAEEDTMAVEILCSGGKPLPCVVCDWCGERIEHGRDGEAWWHVVPGRRFAKPRFAHKGGCVASSRGAVDDAGVLLDLSLDGFLASLRRSTPTTLPLGPQRAHAGALGTVQL
jgi:hypothetical protein